MDNYGYIPNTSHYQIHNTGGNPGVIFYNDELGKVPVLAINYIFNGGIGHIIKSVKISPNTKLVIYTNSKTKTFINDQITDIFINLESMDLSDVKRVMVIVPSPICGCHR